jgi:antitoxin component YwqK of YwqJK toxin-antitoxin module
MTDCKKSQSLISNNKHLIALLKKCAKYTKSEYYVYKACCDVLSKKDNMSKKWLVVMKKIKGTQTNEDRSEVIYFNNAKFRANKLKVIKIFNKNNPDLTKKFITNKYENKKLRYIVGRIVKIDDYDEDLEIVCSNGIHYFKTLEPAYYYGDIQKYYTGKWIYWHDNGQKSSEGNYIDGKRSGHWIYWHDNGQKSSEGNYIDGKRSGHWINWHDNGQKSSEGDYIDGNGEGHWIYWHNNGQKSGECDYINGKKSAHWIYWHNNGQKSIEGDYIDGKISGRWIYWYDNGQKSMEADYIDGKKSGHLICWHKNGQKSMESGF